MSSDWVVSSGSFRAFDVIFLPLDYILIVSPHLTLKHARSKERICVHGSAAKLKSLFEYIKKAFLYCQINYSNANYYDINMMSKFKAPFLSYRNPAIHYSKGILRTNSKYNRSSRLYLKSYINLDCISVPINTSFLLSFLFKLNINIPNKNPVSFNYPKNKNLVVQPNHEVAGGPNPNHKKIILMS